VGTAVSSATCSLADCERYGCSGACHGTPTVRRYPRSLAEAFPDVRAEAIEPPEPRPWLQLPTTREGWGRVIGAGLGIAGAFFFAGAVGKHLGLWQ
jgi:hypothetical protein